MKYVLVVAISMLLGCLVTAAQQIEPTAEKKPAGNERSGMTVQLTPYGYIELPRGYWAYMEKDFMDAWSGYIEKFDGKQRIYFAAGLIQSPFEVYEKEIVWTTTLRSGDFEINYALVEEDRTQRVIASIGGSFFSMEIGSDREIDRFLALIGKYRSGRCESCLSSNWSKSMRHRLEKRFGEQ